MAETMHEHSSLHFRGVPGHANLGVFTEDEIREYAMFKPLNDEQRGQLVKKEIDKTNMQVPNIGGSPETPQSDIQHSTDKGQNMYKSSER